MASLEVFSPNSSPPQDLTPFPLKFSAISSCCIPKESRTNPLGEDAHFVCQEANTIGVADGVGGWAKRGIDSGQYSRQLMFNATVAIKQQQHAGHHIDLPKVLNIAYSNTQVDGSSTACMVILRDQTLDALNVGDSGFRVIRNGFCVYRSPAQQQGSNRCPYQLRFGSTSHRPTSAQLPHVPVQVGDVLVLGSDGLFDNMFDMEIESEVKTGIQKGIGAHGICSRMAELALYNSFDQYGESPFSWEAAKLGLKHKGGKIDDITVVVAFVAS